MIDFVLVINFITYMLLVAGALFLGLLFVVLLIITVVGIIRNILGKDEL